MLVPGVRGLSDHIDVVSIVDRFLEHSRIYYFLNGGDDEMYLSSADWMTRNFDRRIELMFPVESAENRTRVLHALRSMFRDTVKARWLHADGSYERGRPAPGEPPFRVQEHPAGRSTAHGSSRSRTCGRRVQTGARAVFTDVAGARRVLYDPEALWQWASRCVSIEGP